MVGPWTEQPRAGSEQAQNSPEQAHNAPEQAHNWPRTWRGKKGGGPANRVLRRTRGAVDATATYSYGPETVFANRHGPLSVNSGGQCGGVGTARNLLRLFTEKGREGDAIILFGDFNTNAGSPTIQELWKNLVLPIMGLPSAAWTIYTGTCPGLPSWSRLNLGAAAAITRRSPQLGSWVPLPPRVRSVRPCVPQVPSL